MGGFHSLFFPIKENIDEGDEMDESTEDTQ